MFMVLLGKLWIVYIFYLFQIYLFRVVLKMDVDKMTVKELKRYVSERDV